ncbi:MAG: 4Fe-4S binding protein [Planctomycetes bacterium]|nr:4Fe-4S binding protein [Planctomycetota bacterium]
MTKCWRKPLDTAVTEAPRGKIHIIKERCKGCSFCVEFCPKKVLELSSHYNAKGYNLPEVKNPEACIACDLCTIICPDFAIYCEVEKKKPTTGKKLKQTKKNVRS